MNVKIESGIARGTVAAPPSKSMAHRILIAAALSDGVSKIRNVSECDDVSATLDCLRALGIATVADGQDITVYGKDVRRAAPCGELECRESGSTLRFMLPVAAMCGEEVSFCGAGRLMERPMSVYEAVFKEKGVKYRSDGGRITVKGRLPAGEYTVAGNVSSQFITGLILALPLADGDSVIRITPPVESGPYIDMTLAAVKAFGIKAERTDGYTVTVAGNQTYKPTDITVEGDYSGAAFTEALNLFGGDVTVTGLDPYSRQGDRIYGEYFKRLKSGFSTLDLTDCPDLAPILFAVAAAKHGGRFSGTARLKIKESDRAAVMAEELRKLGADITVYENSVLINEAKLHAPREALFGHGDHRIVMSLAVLLTVTGGVIRGAEAVKKSYPRFFGDLKELGISITEDYGV